MIRRGARRDPHRPARPESLREALLRDRQSSVADDAGLRRAGLERTLRDPYAAYDPGPRLGLTVLLALLEAGTVALALLVGSFWLATRPALALPAQARGLAALTEVDALIALRAPDLQRQLDEGNDSLTLADFPVRDLTIDRAEAESPQGDLDPAAYREALLAVAAQQLYERGTEALRASEASGVADRIIEVFLDNLTAQRHEQARVALLAVLGVAAAVKLALLLAARGYRWVALALALVGGGMFALALTLVARGALATLDTPPGAALTEYAALTRTFLDLTMWNALIALGLGLALALPAALGRRRG